MSTATAAAILLVILADRPKPVGEFESQAAAKKHPLPPGVETALFKEVTEAQAADATGAALLTYQVHPGSSIRYVGQFGSPEQAFRGIPATRPDESPVVHRVWVAVGKK